MSLFWSLRSVSGRSLLIIRILIFALWVPACVCAQSKPIKAKPIVAGDALKKAQLFFERNDGQLDREVLYFTRGRGYSVSLERDGIALLKNSSSTVTRLRFIGGAANAKIQGEGSIPGISNYFAGSDPAKWITHVPHFSRVTYKQIYAGIDLVFYFQDGHLEYDFVLSPGANPEAIHIAVEGADAVLTKNGDVVVSSSGTEIVRSQKPLAYVRSQRRPVSVSYTVRDHAIGFKTSAYDRDKELVIDPALSFATFLVGNCPPNSSSQNCESFISGMAADSTGIYLSGTTDAAIFPSLAGQPPGSRLANAHDFAMKLDPTGLHILYQSFFADGTIGGLTIDTTGHAFITGSAISGFPTTPGSFNPVVPSCGTCRSPFAAKLSADGSTLMYSTLLMVADTNASFDDAGPQFAAVDTSGNFYVTGSIGHQFTSIPLRFPISVGAFQTTRVNDGDDFVMKLSPDGSSLLYSTYLHPTVRGDMYKIDNLAVDGAGSAYLVGQAAPSFPTTQGSYQPTATAPSAFLTKLSPDGTSLAYSTFFGTNGEAEGVAVDSSGQAIIVGVSPPGVPTTAGALCQGDPNSLVQGFVAKLNQAGSDLVYSTAVCNAIQTVSGESEEASVAVDGAGAAYVAGTAFRGEFPLLNPIQSYVFPSPGSATTIMKLDATGAEIWGTNLGSSSVSVAGAGNHVDEPVIKLDGTGAVYITRLDANFPATPNALQPVDVNPASGVVLAKIVPSLGTAVPVVGPAAVTFSNSQVTGSSSAPFDVIVGNFGDADMTSAPTVTITTGDFSQTNNCSAAILAAQKCDIQVVFAPTAGGTRTGTLTVKFTGFPDQPIPLTGTATAPVIGLSTALLTFPPEPVGTASSAETLTVTDFGTGPLNISAVQITGDFSQTNTCGNPVAVGSNCTIQITFKPTALGKRLGMVTLVDNDPAGSAKVSLVGFGGQSAGVSLSPQRLNFGGEIVGTSSSAMTVTVTNVGNLTLNVASVGVTGDYSQTNNCSSAIAPSGTCAIQVTFSPTASGPRNGLLTITDNSFTSPEMIPLTGTASDFSLSVAPSSSNTATITAGQTANYTLMAAPTANAGGTVNFSCTGAPAEASCMVSPASLALNNAAQNVTVSVSTTAHGFAIRTPGPKDKTGPFPFVLCVLAVLLAVFALRQRRMRWALAPLAVFLFLMGCGGGSGGGGGGGGGGTPRGTFTIVVTATPGNDAAASHTMNLTLNVQ